MYIENLHVDCKPIYDLTRTEAKFEWTTEHKKLFQNIKDLINEDFILATLDTKHPFCVHVDASSIGVDFILVPEFPEGKRIVSFNARIYTKEEQKRSTTARELCGVISALQTYKHYIIGSPFPVYVYTDHKPLMYLWGRRGKLSHRFFCYQLVISQLQNPKDIVYDQNENDENYFVLHDNEKRNADVFYPILKKSKAGLPKYTFTNDPLRQECIS